MVYLIFFVMIYELGVFMLNPDLLQKPLSEIPGLVVAFAWVHSFLGYLGLSNQLSWIGTPFVIVLILLAMQLTSKTNFKVKIKDFIPMTLESLAWALPLIVLSILFNKVAVTSSVSCYDQRLIPSPAIVLQGEIQYDEIAELPTAAQNKSLILDIVTGIGAGIYEELVFRLFLVYILMIFFQNLLGLERTLAVVYAVVISALLFSLHHHIYFLGGEIIKSEDFVPIKFLFRTLAGIYLAVLFALRGFGMAAATHVYHNILAVIINACFMA